jgi:hypothetical protein
LAQNFQWATCLRILTHRRSKHRFMGGADRMAERTKLQSSDPKKADLDFVRV